MRLSRTFYVFHSVCLSVCLSTKVRWLKSIFQRYEIQATNCEFALPGSALLQRGSSREIRKGTVGATRADRLQVKSDVIDRLRRITKEQLSDGKQKQGSVKQNSSAARNDVIADRAGGGSRRTIRQDRDGKQRGNDQYKARVTESNGAARKATYSSSSKWFLRRTKQQNLSSPTDC